MRKIETEEWMISTLRMSRVNLQQGTVIVIEVNSPCHGMIHLRF